HSDEVFTHHPAASTDNTPLINIGFYETDKAYYIHEFAQIVPPEPGRYRLEVESLESHPVLADLKQVLPDLKYELLVSHYYPRCIPAVRSASQCPNPNHPPARRTGPIS